MKKICGLLMAISLICIFVFNVGASFAFNEDKNFTVEIEDGFVYSEENSSENIYLFQNGEDTFNINYTASTKNDYWADASEEKLNSYAESFAGMMEDHYASMDIECNVDVEYIKLEEVENGYTALVYLLHTTQEETSFYQKMYQFIGENNVYTLTYTSDNKKTVEKVNDIAKTFVMNEEELQKPDKGSEVIYNTIKGACMGICFAVVLVVVKKKNDKKMKGKLENTAYIPEVFPENPATDNSNEN